MFLYDGYVQVKIYQCLLSVCHVALEMKVVKISICKLFPIVMKVVMDYVSPTIYSKAIRKIRVNW